MMSDYTPTTDQVRDEYAAGWEEDFDRWLAAHDSEIRNVAELDALTAAELLMKQREAEIRADEREKAAQRILASDTWLGHKASHQYAQTGEAIWLGVAVAAARGGEQA